jgi:hypothetical protein
MGAEVRPVERARSEAVAVVRVLRSGCERGALHAGWANVGFGGQVVWCVAHGAADERGERDDEHYAGEGEDRWCRASGLEE